MTHKGKVPFAESFDQAQKNTFLRFINPFHPFTEAVTKLFYPSSPSMTEHLKVVDTFAREVTEKRRGELASGMEFRDLLSRFMNAKNNNDEPLSNNEVKLKPTRIACQTRKDWHFFFLAPRHRTQFYYCRQRYYCSSFIMDTLYALDSSPSRTNSSQRSYRKHHGRSITWLACSVWSN